MSESVPELKTPEFKKWPFDSFGQMLKVSGSIEPNIFPYKVSLPADSEFFKNAYDGIYKGKSVTVGNSPGVHPTIKGPFVEHMAVLAADNMGQVMISKEVFQGNSLQDLTDYSQEKLHEHEQLLNKLPLPLGWRRFGYIHSHPIDDVINSVTFPFGRSPKIGGLNVTFSYGDFESLLEPVKHSYKRDTTLAVITPVQIAFMVLTKKTFDVVGRNPKAIDTPSTIKRFMDFPPYKDFEKLGVLLYAGNHSGLNKKEIDLQRLIY